VPYRDDIETQNFISEATPQKKKNKGWWPDALVGCAGGGGTVATPGSASRKRVALGARSLNVR